MKFLILDVLFFVGAFVALFSFGKMIKALLPKSERDRGKLLREKGERNMKRLQEAETFRCGSCNERVDPERDIYLKKYWFHAHCYEQMHK